MKLTQGLVFVCLLVQLFVLSQVQAKRKKSRSNRKDWRMEKLKNMITPMQEDIHQLQKTVESMANPIHIHLHGVSSVDSSTLQQDVGKHKEHHSHAGHEHGHDTHKQDHKHHEHHKHHEKEGAMKRGGKTTKCKNCKHHHGSKEHRSGTKGHGEEEEEIETPNQSHVHIHLNMAAAECGHRRDACLEGDEDFPKDEYRHGCCYLIPNLDSGTEHAMQGNLYLRQKPGNLLEVKVDARDTGRTDGRSLHGIHVHEFADVANGCNAFGGHYNPRGHDHGGPESEESRHPGDWGNIETKVGVVQTAFNASGTLFGRESMIGRGIVVHAGVDDLGTGGTHSSRTTGSPGARIACCAITVCKGSNWE
ncbi:superoxide dismutase [Cu-Zn] [Elysia marginata]|uniref:Superoxide dismutase [Cu-Zn] n=1 Tax=Elysia marginata TaxID=1093978 RepID=A0AAV4FHP7_9GAST|nr:superoxide dismutase [Cu-Zn] [Elysia marginata]